MEPAAGPEPSTIAFDLDATPGSDLSAEDADRARVQVEGPEGVLLDTVITFPVGSPEFSVPVRFSGASAQVEIRVELRREFRPVARGEVDAELRARRVTDVPLELGSPATAPLTPASNVSTGVYHSCATTGAGTFCWGTNESLQLGTESTEISTLPVEAGGDSPGLVSVSTGYVTSCGLDTGGRAFCWGSNVRGSLGTGDTTDETAVPVPIGGTLRFTSISVGGLHACALNAQGRAYCWGFNGFGQLGDGTTTDRPTPAPIGGPVRFAALRAGYVHTCGVTGSGLTYCWGLNEFGQLGDGTQEDRAVPTRVAGGERFTSVATGGLHTCGVRVDQSVACWGYNAFGQLGIGTPEAQLSPASLSGDVRLTTLSAGGLHSCGLTSQGAALCWGYNRSGALGDGTDVDRSTPVAVQTTGVSLAAVSAGLHHTCAITTDGRPACWGFNQFGQVGDGSTLDRFRPQEVLRVVPFITETLTDREAIAARVEDLLVGRVDP
jgi:alpha-tubulin suppressor-like RCC1 family protein